MSADFENALVLGAPGAVAFERNLDRVEEILFAKGLGEELHRPGLHGAHGHWDIAVTGEENDRNTNVGLGEFRLEVEPANSRHSDIEHQAGGGIGKFIPQKTD